MSIGLQEFLFIDFQTTGTVAARSDIIEAGWGLYRADQDAHEQLFHTRLIHTEGAQPLSKTIQKLTGLPADLAEQEGAEVLLFEELRQTMQAFLDEHAQLPILIHYAQFKVPFLQKLLGDDTSHVARVVCLHKLAKVLIPGLKSYSLRAVAGYLGYPAAEKKRSLDHLRASAVIWQNLAKEIGDVDPPQDLAGWLRAMTPNREIRNTLPIHEEALRKKRLSLPHHPGVYFFLDRFQNVLYVGKALDLHHRVNSYFRGRKTKGSRLNEMLTRAVDFRYVEVGSELEALIRENDEIKSIDPPYNRLLRIEGRDLKPLTLKGIWPDELAWTQKTYGPYSSRWMLELLIPLLRGEDISPLIPAYRSGLTLELIQAAISALFASYSLSMESTPSPELWQSLALRAWAKEHERLQERQRLRYLPTVDEEYEEEDEILVEEDEEDEAELVWTVEMLESYLRGTLLHLYRQQVRSRWYLRLAHCTIDWEFSAKPGQWHRFAIRSGVVGIGEGDSGLEPLSYADRLQSFDRRVYDRIGILYAELRKGLRRGDRIRLHLGPKLVLDEAALRRILLP